MTPTPLTRRQTLIGSCLGLAGVLPAPFRRRLPIRRAPEAEGVVRFGAITDDHQDVMHDAAQRVSAFAAGMERRGVDFVTELGDFCQPRPANDGFRDAWQSSRDRAIT